VALERTKTARDAIALMGKLAVEGGFYGEDNVEGTGESFIVVDKTEVWVFHVLASDAQGSSAVWAAARVPDGHVTVVPNIFVIRGMDLSDTDNYLASVNIYDVAKTNGWWDGNKETFDFTKVYSAGEYNHRYYSGRRWWGAMKIMAPNLVFPSNYTNLRDDAPYPFSVALDSPTMNSSSNKQPPNKLAVADVARVMRSFYEGTPFDLTVGLAAGAFGDPNRYDGEIERPGQPGVQGAWERSIAIYRTDYSHILEIDPTLPADTGALMWFAPVGAHTSCYVPFFAGQDTLLPSYGVGHKGGLVDRQHSAMWAFRYVQQVATIRYSRMIADINELQDAMFQRAVTMQQQAAQSLHGNASGLAAVANAHAALVVKSWWALADHLVYKYADGNIYTDASDKTSGKSTPAGYPTWWLTAVGYPSGPPPPVSGVFVEGRD
jgi:dipeptidase